MESQTKRLGFGELANRNLNAICNVIIDCIGGYGTFFTFSYFACEVGLTMIVVLHAKTITNR